MSWAINWYRDGDGDGATTIIAHGDYTVAYLGEENKTIEYVSNNYQVVYLGETESLIEYLAEKYDVKYAGEEIINLDYVC